jgi:hypothetical protein
LHFLREYNCTKIVPKVILRPSHAVKLEGLAILIFTTVYAHLNHKKLFIQGITTSGKPFRPSDWAERLCGVMASFRPPGDAGDPRFTYSPYVRPVVIAKVKCVVIDTRLGDLDPRALDFVMNFAKDNSLPIEEACEFEPKPQTQA